MTIKESKYWTEVATSYECLNKTWAIHIVDKYAYVGENDHIIVYKTSGQFVTSFAIAIGYLLESLLVLMVLYIIMLGKGNW